MPKMHKVEVWQAIVHHSFVMMILRPVFAFALTMCLLLFGAGTALAQNGGQTLADIMARQNGMAAQGSMGAADDAPQMVPDIAGPLGATSDAEIFRAYRDGSADIVSSVPGPTGTVVMQDGGMRWLQIRGGPLPKYGGYLLLGMLAVILSFYLFRGQIRIEGRLNGVKILRFTGLERFAHWLMAGSFILLGLTGLMSLFARIAIIPLLGNEIYAPIASVGKFIHNYVAWPFILSLVMILLLWVTQNFPTRADIKWLLKAGGLFTKGVHPPAGKFNAGEKFIFWSVIVLGGMITATGLSLLFPYQLIMFAPTFEALNHLGISQLLGLGELNTALAPQEEMQLSQLWHAVVAFVFMAIILAHIYLGSIGMEGAYNAMRKGKVETQWAKEHHSLWYEDVIRKAKVPGKKKPAE